MMIPTFLMKPLFRLLLPPPQPWTSLPAHRREAAPPVLTIILLLYVAMALSVGLYPLAWWASCVVDLFRTYLWLGHWPVYGQPEAKSLPGYVHTDVQVLGILAIFTGVVLVVGISTILIVKIFPRRRWLPVATLVWILLWIATYGLLKLDPGGVVQWVVD